MPSPETGVVDLADLTAKLVSAYVANNSVPMSELHALLVSVHAALAQLDAPSVTVTEEPELKPAVPIRKSIEDNHLVCLEDGEKFKVLKRHIRVVHGMTPVQYRERWGLPKSYPMVAPSYAKSRSTLAKTLGLGRKSPNSGRSDRRPS